MNLPPIHPESPKNVEAIRQWMSEHRKDILEGFDLLLKMDRHAPNEHATAVLGLMLMSFEAGREFQRVSPDVESGAGYV